MDTEILGLILRFAERLTVVAIGGLSIYLGYRLFFDLPLQHSQTGEISLPGIKVVLSKGGPGIFFAAFGAVIVGYSWANPLVFTKNESAEKISYATPTTTEVPTAPTWLVPSVTPQKHSLVLTAIETLNCLDSMAEQNDTIKTDAAIAIRLAKVALLRSIWDTEKWGASTALDDTGPSQQANLEVKNVFQAKSKSTCPY